MNNLDNLLAGGVILAFVVAFLGVKYNWKIVEWF